MNIKKLEVCILFLIPFELFANTITLRGSIDCGDWLKAREVQQSSPYEAYVIGVVNGMAIGRLIDLWNFEGNSTSGNQVFYWLDNYCKKNPLKNVNSALFEFADERTDGAWRASTEK